MNAAIKKAIEQSPMAQQALAAKQGINQLTTAIPDAVQGVKNAVGEQLEAQKDAVKGIVDERIAAAGLPAPGNVPAESENEPTEPVEGNGEYTNEVGEGNGEYAEEEDVYEGGARRRRRSSRRKVRKISRKGIRQMASRRGSRRATRRRATRKGRRASRRANRKSIRFSLALVF